MSLPDSEGVTNKIARLDWPSLWTVSNALSALRVVLAAPTLYYIWLGPEHRWYVFGIVIAMVLSDILDGVLARARNEVTEWGKIIDPIADKLAIDSIAVLLVYVKGLPFWLAAAVIGRDVLIVIGGVLLASRIKVVPASNSWGKATTCVMAALLLTFAMDFDPPKPMLVALAGFLILASAISYVINARNTSEAS
ncbi:MAG: CDP-alcohol phosphatidyltransferase family protein [Candidatus Latescibacterota bacterium]|nr:CDP-alcohol phosphatidyltransferase family protein [Candidatus Latescibacterota bacterium]